MSIDSSVAGYLGQTSGPIEGSALQDFLQAVIAGITGIAGQYVRPRWQPEPPNLPGYGSDWCAFGIVSREADPFGMTQHDPAGNGGSGSDNVSRHENLDVLVSFYGPNADANAGQLRDGLLIDQNRAALTAADISLIGIGEVVSVPSLVKDRWLYRVDLPVFLRRLTTRTFNILTIESGQIVLDNEHYTETINVS